MSRTIQPNIFFFLPLLSHGCIKTHNDKLIMAVKLGSNQENSQVLGDSGLRLGEIIMKLVSGYLLAFFGSTRK